MTKQKSLLEYKKFAQEFDLIFLGNSLPQKTITPTEWKCLICGRQFYKSMRNIRRYQPCICRGKTHLKKSDYILLGKSLGIFWSSDQLLPKNVRQNTEWYSSISNENFVASYADLKYHGVNSDLRRHIWTIKK